MRNYLFKLGKNSKKALTETVNSKKKKSSLKRLLWFNFKKPIEDNYRK